jgi:acetyl-CoA C-acetyltransferase
VRTHGSRRGPRGRRRRRRRAPEEFPIAPIDAIRKVLAQAQLGVADIDLWEINEAFAVVVLAAVQALDLDPARVNVNGGSDCPRPSDRRERRPRAGDAPRRSRAAWAQRGVASLCLGGGEAVAMIVERDA